MFSPQTAEITRRPSSLVRRSSSGTLRNRRARFIAYVCLRRPRGIPVSQCHQQTTFILHFFSALGSLLSSLLLLARNIPSSGCGAMTGVARRFDSARGSITALTGDRGDFGFQFSPMTYQDFNRLISCSAKLSSHYKATVGHFDRISYLAALHRNCLLSFFFRSAAACVIAKRRSCIL